MVRSDRVGSFLVFVAGLVAVAGMAAAQASPYAGLENREIKALSPEQVSQYLEGEGMGLALPAELGGYPGPKHVLELAQQLDLDRRQVAEIQAIFDAMRAEAIRLGKSYVEGERRLDSLFSSGAVATETLRSALDELGRLHSRLRFVHLDAHLETREKLSAAQVARYAELRGYGSEADGAGHRHRHEHGQD